MARLVLITGGARSGKSDYALRLGEALAGPRLFLATCPPVDAEMEERIRRHQASRDAEKWDTLEEPLGLVQALQTATGYRVVLIDCLTLWINNILYEAGLEQAAVTEEDVSSRAKDLLSACAGSDGTIIMVTNEVGMGLVPENPQARLYRDLVGRCNRTIAQEADQVIFVACGQPLTIKG